MVIKSPDSEFSVTHPIDNQSFSKKKKRYLLYHEYAWFSYIHSNSKNSHTYIHRGYSDRLIHTHTHRFIQIVIQMNLDIHIYTLEESSHYTQHRNEWQCPYCLMYKPTVWEELIKTKRNTQVDIHIYTSIYTNICTHIYVNIYTYTSIHTHILERNF